MSFLEDAPEDLTIAIEEFWPEHEMENAAAIAHLESNWDPFAENNTTTPDQPCGSILYVRDGMNVTAEHSVGYFQINACNLPKDWKWYHLFNARHNAGTAHALWDSAGGWYPWYYSALKLGLIVAHIRPASDFLHSVRHVTPQVALHAARWDYNRAAGSQARRPLSQPESPHPSQQG